MEKKKNQFKSPKELIDDYKSDMTKLMTKEIGEQFNILSSAYFELQACKSFIAEKKMENELDFYVTRLNNDLNKLYKEPEKKPKKRRIITKF